MREDLFRKQAVSHLSGMDSTDQPVTQPQLSLWIVLGGVLILLGIIFIAAMVITIPQEVRGMGLAIQNGTETDVVFLVPLESGSMINPGMATRIFPISKGSEDEGYISGMVTSVSPSPINRSIAVEFFGDDLADVIIAQSGKAPFAVRASLLATPGGFGGADEQNPRTLPGKIVSGTPVWGRVVTKETRAISLIFPWLGSAVLKQ